MDRVADEDLAADEDDEDDCAADEDDEDLAANEDDCAADEDDCAANEDEDDCAADEDEEVLAADEEGEEKEAGEGSAGEAPMAGGEAILAGFWAARRQTRSCSCLSVWSCLSTRSLYVVAQEQGRS